MLIREGNKIRVWNRTQCYEDLYSSKKMDYEALDRLATALNQTSTLPHKLKFNDDISMKGYITILATDKAMGIPFFWANNLILDFSEDGKTLIVKVGKKSSEIKVAGFGAKVNLKKLDDAVPKLVTLVKQKVMELVEGMYPKYNIYDVIFGHGSPLELKVGTIDEKLPTLGEPGHSMDTLCKNKQNKENIRNSPKAMLYLLNSKYNKLRATNSKK